MVQRLTSLLILAVVAIASAVAQNPVKWRATARMTDDTHGTLTIKATMEPGWHVYSTKLPEDGPQPTVIKLGESRGVKIDMPLRVSKAPIEKDDALRGMRLSYWEDEVTFTTTFTLTGRREDAKVAGSVTFMACDDSSCMPPKTVEISSVVLPKK